jgi:hypothetical protein
LVDLAAQVLRHNRLLAALTVIGKDGRFIEASTVGREGAVGLHSGLGRRRSFTRATAQIGGNFSTIQAARFEHIANGSAPIWDVILRYTEVLWAETQQIAACNALHSASARLCRWLLQSADRIESWNFWHRCWAPAGQP